MNELPDAELQFPNYWAVLKSLAPIMFMGALSGLAYGLKRIVLEETWKDKLVAVLVTSVPSGVVSCIFVLLLPLVIDQQLSPSVELGLAGIFGGMGTKGFDLLLKRFYNLIVVEGSKVSRSALCRDNPELPECQGDTEVLAAAPAHKKRKGHSNPKISG